MKYVVTKPNEVPAPPVNLISKMSVGQWGKGHLLSSGRAPILVLRSSASAFSRFGNESDGYGWQGSVYAHTVYFVEEILPSGTNIAITL